MFIAQGRTPFALGLHCSEWKREHVIHYHWDRDKWIHRKKAAGGKLHGCLKKMIKNPALIRLGHQIMIPKRA